MKKAFSIILILAIVVGGSIGIIYYFNGGDRGYSVSLSDNNEHVLTWNEVEGANRYKLLIDEEEISDDANIEGTEITEYLLDDGTYKLTIVAYDGADNILNTTEYSHKYLATTPQDFKRQTYFMNGVVADRYIESKDELKLLVWHTLLYQNNNIRFYIATNQINKSNLNTLIMYYMYNDENSQESYPEYDGLYYAASYNKFENNNIAKLTNFSYYLTLNHTLTTANCTVANNRGLVNYREWNDQPTKDPVFNQPYITAADSGQARTFALEEDDTLLQVPVYNTEQLMMVVQYGAAPIFPEGYSVVKTVYNNAKTVLSQINSDSLTDYEKVLNIYRYLVNNVTYDHVLFGYMEYVKDSTVFTFGNFNVFYMESILYDLNNQVSVCDGIAKTFTLLCRLEGIESTKINGIAGSTIANGGNHAWNKVKIDEEYYIVDATWGVNGYYDSELEISYEFATHAYFLVSESSISTTHKATFEIETKATKDYNYFKNLQYEYLGGTVSQYVESEEGLAKILEYLVVNNQIGIEIEFSNEFIADMKTKYILNPNGYVVAMLQATNVNFDSYLYDFGADGNYLYIIV